MTSTGARAGRGHLARLVVVAVLAGLALMVGVQCSDGMSTAMPMVHSTTTAMSMDEHERDMDLGELTMCLVVVVAVAAAAVVLTQPVVRATVVAQAASPVARPESARSRAPSLARLGLLRI